MFFDMGLTLGQQCQQRAFALGVATLNREEAQALLVHLYRQLLWQEALYQYQLKPGQDVPPLPFLLE